MGRHEGAGRAIEGLALVSELGRAVGGGEQDVVPVVLRTGSESGVRGERDQDGEVDLGGGDARAGAAVTRVGFAVDQYGLAIAPGRVVPRGLEGCGEGEDSEADEEQQPVREAKASDPRTPGPLWGLLDGSLTARVD